MISESCGFVSNTSCASTIPELISRRLKLTLLELALVTAGVVVVDDEKDERTFD